MPNEQAVRLEDLLAQSSWMRALARSLVSDPSTADDLAQEAMLAALTKPPDEGVPLRAWLAGVLRNLAAGLRRSEAQRSAREARAEHRTTAPSTDELVGQVEVQQRLGEDVLALPDPYKRTVLLRYFQGLSSAEIARRTNTPEGTVRWRLKRGLDMLRERLDAHHDGDRKAWVAVLSTGLGAPLTAPVGGLAPAAVVQLVGLVAIALLLALAVPLGARFLRKSPASSSAALAPADVARRDVELESTSTPRAADVRSEPTAPDSAPSLPDLRVRARVLDDRRAPIEAARLSLGYEERTLEARTDLAGEVSLVIPDFVRGEGEMLIFALEAPGHLPRTVRARHRGEQLLWLGDQVLVPAAMLVGRVVDDELEPVAGATVTIESLPVKDKNLARWSLDERRLRAIAPPDALASATTDAQGRFRFEALPAQYVRIWADAPEAWSGCSDAVGLLAGEELDAGAVVVASKRAAERIAGVVHDPDGAPRAGAEVIGIPEPQADKLYLDNQLAYTTTTDEAGRFELWVEAESGYVVGATDPRDALGRSLPRPAAGGDRGVVLALRPGHFAELVASEPDGTPLAGFAVEVLDAEKNKRRDRVRMTETERGVARFELPDFPFKLRVGKPGSQRRVLGPFQPGHPVERYEAVLEPVDAITGRVTHRGEPLEGARVSLQRAHKEGQWSARPDLTLGRSPFSCFIASTGYDAEMHTRADGRFALRPTTPDRMCVLVDAPGLPRLVVGPAPVKDLLGTGELELGLPSAGSIEGVVLPEAGREPAGTLVGVSAGDGRLFVQRVGLDGAYRFDGLAPGAWQVRALLDDLDRDEEEGVLRQSGQHHLGPIAWDVVVEPGEVARFDLSLTRRSAATLEGRLSFDGRSPGPWRIDLISHDGPAEGERNVGSLGSDGRFRYELRYPGRYELYFSTGGSDEPWQRLVDHFEVGAGGNEWERSLRTSRVHVERSDASAVVADRYTLLWTEPGGTFFTAAVVPASDARSLEMVVPAGHVRVVDARFGAATPDSAPLAEVELEPGGQGVIRLP